MSYLTTPWVTWDKPVVPHLVLTQVIKFSGIPGECFVT